MVEGGLRDTSRSAASSQRRAALLTLSYGGDLQLFTILARTVDKFAGNEIDHYVSVPNKDLSDFKRLQTDRRTFIPQEELLPAGLHRIPLPSPALRARLGLPPRNFYTCSVRPLVSGWIVQQIMKISFAAKVSEEVVVHVDSDLAFVKHFSATDFLSDGRTRLFRVAGQPPSSLYHGKSFNAAVDLLGIDRSRTTFTNFIGSVIPWNKSCVLKMMEHIETTRSEKWSSSLLRSPTLAEYMLYGIFSEYCLGIEQAGHVCDSVGFCETVWGDGQYSNPTELGGRLQKAHMAVGLQSTLSLDLAERNRILEHVTSVNS